MAFYQLWITNKVGLNLSPISNFAHVSALAFKVFFFEMTSTKGGGPPCLCPKGSKCSLKSPAVNLGTGIFSDKSVDLLKNVDDFVRKHTKVSREKTLRPNSQKFQSCVKDKREVIETYLLNQKVSKMYF